MTENILDIRRLAEMPKTVGGQQLFIFVPLANAYEPGIASFSSQDFTVTGRSAMVTINTNKFVTLTKLTEELAKKVDKTTKINNKSLDKDIVIYASDVPMAANDSTSVLAKFGLVDAKIAKLEQDTSAVYRYRGSVNTYADLLSIWDSKIGTGSQKPRVGDTYDVKSLNMNYAFVDEVSATAPNGWDALGQLFVLTPATPNKIGGVKPDDMTIGVKEDGTIYAKPATNDKPGIVQPDGISLKIENGKLKAIAGGAAALYTDKQIDLILKSIDYNFDGTLPNINQLVEPVYLPQTTDAANPQTKELNYAIGIKDTKSYLVKWFYNNGAEKELTVLAAFTPTAEGLAIPTLVVETGSVGESFVIYDGAVGTYVDGVFTFTAVGDMAIIINEGKAFDLVEIKEVEATV